MYDKPLPIGSVVLLKNAEKKLMILGYLKYGLNNNTDIYDYAGCTYPEGFLSPNETLIFNHSDIQRIYALGYQDEKQQIFEESIIKEFRKNKSDTIF